MCLLPPIDTSVLTEWIINLFSPALVMTDMDVDKAPGDEETDDAATSKASMLHSTWIYSAD